MTTPAGPNLQVHPYQKFESEKARAGVSFDDTVPEGVDPHAQWRLQNSRKFQRTGSTAAERAGGIAGYTPGYGRASNQNSNGASSLTPRAEWDAQFEPRLSAQMMQPQGSAAPLNTAPLNTAPIEAPAGGGIPPAGPALPTATPSLPVLPSPGSPGVAGVGSRGVSNPPPINNMHGEISRDPGGRTTQVQIRPYDASKVGLTGNAAVDSANVRGRLAANLDWAANPTMTPPVAPPAVTAPGAAGALAIQKKYQTKGTTADVSELAGRLPRVNPFS